MKKEQTTVKVSQSIRYLTSQEQDYFQHEGPAELFNLSTFTKLRYIDEHGILTEVKHQGGQLQVKRGESVFQFAPHRLTQTQASGLSVWVKTQTLQVMEGNIQVMYQLIIDQEPLGDYEFRLQYKA